MKQSLHPYVIRSRIGLRSGALVCLEDEHGRQGWGDIAPLPGFSPESLDEAIASLAGAMTPSAHFGWETAQLRLQAVQQGSSMRSLLNPRASDRVAVNGLCHIGTEPPRDYPVLKVKVARQPVDVELAWLKSKFSGRKQRLRLDANQGWTRDEAWTFAERCQDLPIDYIEEPYPGAVLDAHDFPLPLAADETIYQDLARLAGLSPRVTALVLKPSLIGGPSRLKPLLAAGERTVVFSSCFESSVGASSVAELAAAYQAPGTAAGLDPWTWLEEDVLGLHCPITHASVDLRSWTLPTSSDSSPSMAISSP